MEKKNLTCIVCPLGWNVTAELDGERIIGMTGQSCKRGEAYVRAELQDPRRTLTTTMRVEGAGLVPVKSRGTLPKGLLQQSMAVINAARAHAPVNIGDVLIHDLLNTGVDIVATDCA